MKATVHTFDVRRPSGKTLERLTFVWSLIRAIVFVLTCFQWASSPAQAQNNASQQMILPNCSGANIVGRIVSAENPTEGVVRCRVLVNGADMGITTDSKGYYVMMNMMKGRYTLTVLSPEGSETGASRVVVVRGNDVTVPTIAVETPQYAIYGRVTYAHDRSRGLANVKIRLNSGLTIKTDSLGYYALENVRFNGTYTITAEAHGLTIFGATRTVTVTQTMTRQNFIVESPAIAENNDASESVSPQRLQGNILQSNIPQSEVLIGLPRVHTNLTRNTNGNVNGK